MTATVDDDLFPCLLDAINFVASCGGGIVHTSLYGTLYANGLKLPFGVTLAGPRLAEKPEPKPSKDSKCQPNSKVKRPNLLKP